MNYARDTSILTDSTNKLNIRNNATEQYKTSLLECMLADENRIRQNSKPSTCRNTILAETRVRAISSHEQDGQSLHKWKKFALLLAESYDKLKVQAMAINQENIELKQAMQTTTANNEKLTFLLKEAEQQNKELLCELDKISVQYSTGQFASQLDAIKTKYNNELKSKSGLYKIIDKLKKELTILKQQCILTKEEKDSIEIYKRLANERMAECKQLAEQLICLRSDLDITNIQNSKIKCETQTLESEDISERVHISMGKTCSKTVSPHVLTCHSNFMSFGHA